MDADFQEARMKIAVTADLHLTTRAGHPERYAALENILGRMSASGIDTLVISGDCFDQSLKNLSEFEAFCRQPKHRKVRFILIAGNHDPISQRMISVENITIYSNPSFEKSDLLSLPILSLPYQPNRTMGEAIAATGFEIPTGQWILIGHGDWAAGFKEPNPAEPGVYMPLTRPDIERFRPVRAVLGHIHKPGEDGVVIRPGSPCPLDINETGRRRFLVLDTETGGVESWPVDSDVLHFNETLIVVPLDDEVKYIHDQIDRLLKDWKLTDAERSKTVIRIRAAGYSTDKKVLAEIIRAGFHGFTFDGNGPDLDAVSVSDDTQLAEIARLAAERIPSLDWPRRPDEPDKPEILTEALRVIYGGEPCR
jgi:DNA repair exonuclease SbcCD nuclease subunit